MRKVFFIFILLGVVLSIFSINQKATTARIVKPIPIEKEKSEKIENAEQITLISTGDIGLVRDINYRIIQQHDVNYPFLKIAEYLRSADLTVINLEGPLIENCPVIVTGFKFCGSPANVKGLIYAGIDAANLANNHITNYGLDGLSQTETTLKNEGIKPYGANDQVQYLNVKGKRFALVGFVELGNNWEGLNNATNKKVSNLVSFADRNSDIVIVSFHWGVEYTHNPTENQILLAHTAIDNGADIVLGNHPHWIQINEIYKDKFITYAQGNTIFDQDWSQETKEGVLYKFAYKNGKFQKIEEKYTVIEDNSQPRFATLEEATKIKNCLIKICNN